MLKDDTTDLQGHGIRPSWVGIVEKIIVQSMERAASFRCANPRTRCGNRWNREFKYFAYINIRIEKLAGGAIVFAMTSKLTKFCLFSALTAVASFLPATALAQKCTEQFVKDSPMPTPFETKAPDVYFFPGMADKPIVGAQQWKNWSENEQKTSTRKNTSSGSCKKDRVVAAPSAEMAYAYGTCGSTSDEADGKRQDLILAFLEVWRVVDGTCKLAARQIHAQGGER